jgi:tetratricopeptide (TPR) repeat protein
MAGMMLVMSAAAYFALRPPYAQRQYQAGVVHAKAHEDIAALECFSESLLANPQSAEAWIARARVRKHLKQFNDALDDYNAASKLADSPILDACKGYCDNRRGHNDEAEASYLRAKSAGFETPAILNNRGYGFLQDRNTAEAEKYLRKALEMNPRLQAAHHNLVMLFVNRAMQTGEPVSAEAISHAREAESTGPGSGELYRDIAYLYALAANENSSFAEAAIASVAKAVAHGIDPKDLRDDPIFTSLEQDSGFHKALSAPVTSQSPLAVRVIDPDLDSQ